MTKLEIIEDTEKFYTEDPKRRAMEEESYCAYRTNDNRRCAVGRWMIEPTTLMQGTVCNLTGLDVFEQELSDKLLVPEVHGHELAFWAELQRFHDGKSYWDDKGLTDYGRQAVESLKTKWGNK